MPKVWNMSDPARPKMESEGGTAIYIGRPGPWSIPYTIGRHGSRAEVIQKYEELLRTQKLPHIHVELLAGKDLICWCSPAACHGDILLHYANMNPPPRDPS